MKDLTLEEALALYDVKRDTLIWDERREFIYDGKYLLPIKKGLSDFTLTVEYAIKPLWQVENKKQEPITAEEYMDKIHNYDVTQTKWRDNLRATVPIEYEYTAFVEGEKNRDLVYSDLIIKLEEYKENDLVQWHESGILEAMAKLKQQLENK